MINNIKIKREERQTYHIDTFNEGTKGLVHLQGASSFPSLFDGRVSPQCFHKVRHAGNITEVFIEYTCVYNLELNSLILDTFCLELGIRLVLGATAPTVVCMFQTIDAPVQDPSLLGTTP
jgi:hypothetical protein